MARSPSPVEDQNNEFGSHPPISSSSVELSNDFNYLSPKSSYNATTNSSSKNNHHYLGVLSSGFFAPQVSPIEPMEIEGSSIPTSTSTMPTTFPFDQPHTTSFTTTSNALDTLERNKITNMSSALVLYNPALYQNRGMIPLPVGWTTSSKSPTSFPLSLLPPELRIMVWKYLITPRSVKIRMDRRRRDKLGNKYTNSIKSTTPRPILMSICRESRSYILPNYKTLFDVVQVSRDCHLRNMQLRRGDQLTSDERRFIYFNPAIDSLRMDAHDGDLVTFLANSSPEDLMSIKVLTMDWSFLGPHVSHPGRGYGNLYFCIETWWWASELSIGCVLSDDIFNHFKGLEKLRMRRCNAKVSPYYIREDKDIEYEAMKSTLEYYKSHHPEWSLPALTILPSIGVEYMFE